MWYTTVCEVWCYSNFCCGINPFFFQAEDGIRDLYVTGVQTCALPISARRSRPRSRPGDEETHPAISAGDFVSPPGRLRVTAAATLGMIGPRAEAALPTLADGAAQSADVEYRSEERRVGEEWSTLWRRW